jgi:WD40 repeat protein
LAIQSRLSGNELPFRLIDSQRWKELRRFNFGNGGHAMAFLPGTEALFYLSGSSANLRDLADGKYQELPELADLGNQPTLALSHDGRFLALGHIGGKKKGALRLWETVSKKTVWLVDTGKMDPTAVAFSPDNSSLAMGSRDGEVSLWDTRSGRALHRFAGHQGDVRSLAFSRDGKHLASGSADTTILVWDITKIAARPRPAAIRLTENEMRELWILLGSEDVPLAQRAAWRFIDASDHSIAFLAKGLFIVKGAGITEERVRHRQLRVMQILECIGTNEACRLLTQMGDKHPVALIRNDAIATFTRIRQHAPSTNVKKDTLR